MDFKREFVPLGFVLHMSLNPNLITLIKNGYVLGVLTKSRKTLLMPEVPCPVRYLPKKKP